ncbi:MAG: hypothetical protein HC892_07515 [Saprospiraceae bacterium]|nr:hypothetical protein [Saprospiraceae bacterium]
MGVQEGDKANVNLFDFANYTSSSSRATTYALGNTQIQLVNAETGVIKLFWDDYDWDFHNYPSERRLSNRLPESYRDKLIYFERARTGIDDSHGFRVLIFGTTKIKLK